jgi:Tannase-like family of unknown function (DUF6351)
MAAIALVLAMGTAGQAVAKGGGKLRVESLSSDPELVTDGDALIAVDVPKGTPSARVRVERNGVDVTGAFEFRSADRQLVGLVDGLRPKQNRIAALASGSNRAAELTVFNSPITGPLFSGPHQSPFVCTTDAAGLGAPTDADCSAPTRVEYRYRSTGGGFKPLADPNALPTDVAQTTTRDGRTVPYVVRVESGTINRSIYRWAVLAPGGVPADGWNGRLVYSFGGGCGAGYQQGSDGIGTVLDDRQLSKGYSVASSSLTVLGTACNDVLSAETVAMVKEHIIETLGQPPVWTVGDGGSGGSIQQQMIAQNYPGLLNGLMPGASFPDSSQPNYPDCRLLNAYYASTDGQTLTDPQKIAVDGLADPDGCTALSAGADVVNATEGCDESVVGPLVYNPVTNPGGARCTIWDSMVNVFGRDPATGFARRTLDNVGVQYGLVALQQGAITVKQFLDLNQGIGGYDNDGNIVASRSVADSEALALAYRTGRINQTAGGFTDVPIVDIRDYVDNEINVHQYLNTFITRARLIAAHGTAANQVMFRAKGGQNTSAMQDAALDTIGRWLDTIAADGSKRPLPEKVIADKPADAVDACWISGQRINEPAQIGGTGQCQTTYTPHSLPAQQAGKPLDSLVAKCQLKPTDPADYPALNANQTQRLATIFPDGVCDWSKPGVGQQALAATWQQFGPEHTIKARKRDLSLKADTSGGGSKVELTARMMPCPGSSWQRVAIERKVGRQTWKPLAGGIITGRRCEFTARVGFRKTTVIRAHAKSVTGFTGAHSKQVRIRVAR